MDDAQTLLGAVATWGRQRPDVQAVLLVGSHARTELPADRWSDIDLVMVVDDRHPTPPATTGSARSASRC